MPIRPTKNAHPTYKKRPSDLRKIWPSDLRKMPIRPTKKCPYDLRNPSDLQNWVAVWQLQLFISTLLPYMHDKSCWIGRMGKKICPSDLQCRRSDVAVGRVGSIADGQYDGWAVERINITLKTVPTYSWLFIYFRKYWDLRKKYKTHLLRRHLIHSLDVLLI